MPKKVRFDGPDVSRAATDAAPRLDLTALQQRVAAMLEKVTQARAAVEALRDAKQTPPPTPPTGRGRPRAK